MTKAFHMQYRKFRNWKVQGGGLVTKSCPTLVTPWTAACQAPLSIHGILQAGILEWVAISFSYVPMHVFICIWGQGWEERLG